LQFIYSNDNIPEAVVKVLLENKIAKKLEENILHQADIKRRIEQILGHDISDRQLRKNLSSMKDQKLLNKYDLKEGKRGYKVYYSPTEKAEKMYVLKILGSDETIERRKNLYQLLIFFEVFKTNSPLTHRQLGNFLKRIGKSMDHVEEAKVTKEVTHFRPIKGVQIIKWIQNNSELKSNAAIYHITIPGFTVKEVNTYLHQLRKGNKAHSTPSYSVSNVPYVLDLNYSQTEITTAIESLRYISLIKPIDSIFSGETRYRITDVLLAGFAKDVWLLHDIELRLLFEKLVYEGKPQNEAKSYLKHVYGKRIADRILISAYDTRKFTREQESTQGKKNAKVFIQLFDRYRKFLIGDIVKNHKNAIEKYEVVSELVEGICFSPLFT
jgi:DNA-binding PadR family transcriptional regulator